MALEVGDVFLERERASARRIAGHAFPEVVTESDTQKDGHDQAGEDAARQPALRRRGRVVQYPYPSTPAARQSAEYNTETSVPPPLPPGLPARA